MSPDLQQPVEIFALALAAVGALVWVASGVYVHRQAALYGRHDWEAAHLKPTLGTRLAFLGVVGLAIWLLVVTPRFHALDRPEVFF